MNILGVTLARGGSKSIPQKNIVDLNGSSLLSYTVKEALESKYLTNYLISTDCPNIAAEGKRLGALVPFMRPAELSTDIAPSLTALQHAAEFAEKMFGVKYDLVVELMATAPFKTAEDIDACIQLCVKNEVDSVIAVRQIFDQHPARVKVIDTNGLLQNFCVSEPLEARRQDLAPPAFIRAGAIYCLKRHYLFDAGARYGKGRDLAYVLSGHRGLNIDEPEDLLVAKALIEKFRADHDA